jgi:transcriptional regulator with XRE-family HTH domain
MQIFERLKAERRRVSYTLIQLSEKVGYGAGNLSSYETGKLKPRDPTILRILTLGYKYSQKTARAKLAHWRIQEVYAEYTQDLNLKISQNERIESFGLLDFYLQEEGLNKKEVFDIKNCIALYQHKQKEN